MDRKDFTAGINDNDRRIDKVIRKFLPDTNLTDIYKAFRKGLIKINDKKVKIDSRVYNNDIISIPVFMLNNSVPQKNENISIELPQVIFENDHLITFNKPYDTLVQGNDNSLDKVFQKWFKLNSNDLSLSFTPGPLHRLDRKTTGLITFSKSISGAHWFSENIKNHTIHKKYLTILQGIITNDEVWEDFIEKTEDSRTSFHTVKASSVKNDKSDNEKAAYTYVHPIKTGKYKNVALTFAEIEIKTGRMHQIRAQASLHNHPLLGDTAYNGIKINTDDSQKDFFLHAYKLTSPDNDLGFPAVLNTKIPEDFKNFLSKSCDIEISEV